MKLTLYNHADDFLADNKEFIYANSLEADLVYGNAHCSLSTEQGFYGASVKTNNETLLAIQVNQYPRVHFSDCADAKKITNVLAKSYADNNQIPDTINGDTKTVKAMVESLKEHNLHYSIHLDLVKRKCTLLNDVAVPDLDIVNAKEIDFDFTDYYIKFATECNMPFDKSTAKDKVDKIVKSGNLYALVIDEQVVTIAASSRKTENGRAVNMVYTPPEHRGMGYSTCCVKQLTEIILEEHDYAFLYADKANPISNHVYEKLGYAVYGDICQYNLEKA